MRNKGHRNVNVDLTIRLTGRMGNRGAIYEVLHKGKVIATGASPEFAACRVLVDQGYHGSARFWREGKASWDFKMSIAWGAVHCVIEKQNAGPRFGKWSPSPFADKADEGFGERISDPLLFAIPE